MTGFSAIPTQSTRRAMARPIVALLLVSASIHGQTAEPKSQMSEDVFKNVQVLKGIPVDEFLGTMGVFSAALGISCEDCHKADDSKWENLAIDSPMKRRARGMLQMMAALNKNNFGGRQMVTCYTCHRGNQSPRVTASLARLYGMTPTEEPVDVIEQSSNQPSADQILDKYIQALGGAQKLAALTSFIATGSN